MYWQQHLCRSACRAEICCQALPATIRPPGPHRAWQAPAAHASWSACPRKRSSTTAVHSSSILTAAAAWPRPTPAHRSPSIGHDEFEADEPWDDSQEHIHVEDYTWSGDADLDTPEDDPVVGSSTPVLDLTRPSLLQATGSTLETDKLLRQAMDAVYKAQHSRYTMGTKALTAGMRQLMQADAGRKLRAAFGTLDALSELQPAATALPPVPPRYCGSVCMAHIPGKGLGLQATDVIEPGECLLISEPLAFIIAPLTPPPPPPPPPTASDKPDTTTTTTTTRREARAQVKREVTKQVRRQLLKQLQELQDRLPDWHPARVALTSLWRGNNTRSGSPGQAADPEEDIRQIGEGIEVGEAVHGRLGRDNNPRQGLLHLMTWQPLPNFDETANTTDNTSETTPLVAQQLTPAELKQLIRYNAVIDMTSDELLASMRGEAPVSVSGVWPEAALMNHSCAPNAVHVMVGGRLIVRAAARILPGEEVTINYLGGLGPLQPYRERQRKLRSRWHFTCDCRRCRREEDVDQQLGSALEDVQDLVDEMRGILQHLMTQHTATTTTTTTTTMGATSPSNTTSSVGDSSSGAGSSRVATDAGVRPPPPPLPLPNTLDLSRIMAKGTLRSPVSPRKRPVQGLELPEDLIENLRELENQAVEIRDQLHVSVRLLPSLMTAGGGGAEQALGGAFDLYDLIATLRELRQPGSHRSLQAQESCTLAGTAVQATHPVVLTRLAHMTAQSRDRYGISDQSTVMSQNRCAAAFSSRYGALPHQELQLMMSKGVALFDTYFKSVITGEVGSWWEAAAQATQSQPFKPPAWAAPAWQWNKKLLKTAKKLPPPSSQLVQTQHTGAAAAAPAVLTAHQQSLPVVPATAAVRSSDAVLHEVVSGLDSATKTAGRGEPGSGSAALGAGRGEPGSGSVALGAAVAAGSGSVMVKRTRRSRSASSRGTAAGRKGRRSKSKASQSPSLAGQSAGLDQEQQHSPAVTVAAGSSGGGPEGCDASSVPVAPGKRPRGRPRKSTSQDTGTTVPAASEVGQAQDAVQCTAGASGRAAHGGDGGGRGGMAAPQPGVVGPDKRKAGGRRAGRASRSVSSAAVEPGDSASSDQGPAVTGKAAGGQQAGEKQRRAGKGKGQLLWGDDDDDEEEQGVPGVGRGQAGKRGGTGRSRGAAKDSWLDSWAR